MSNRQADATYTLMFDCILNTPLKLKIKMSEQYDLHCSCSFIIDK